MLDDQLASSSSHFNAAKINMSLKGNFGEESHYTGLCMKMHIAEGVEREKSSISVAHLMSFIFNVCGS